MLEQNSDLQVVVSISYSIIGFYLMYTIIIVSSAQIYSNLQSPDRPQSVGKIDARPTSVTYFNNIIRPQPLPPIPNTSSVNEVM